MKIGIDARMYGYAQTGIGNYIRHLIEYINKNDKDNEYVIFFLPEEYDNFDVKNKNIKKVKVFAKWYSWKEQYSFLIEVYKEKLDLMHFVNFNSPVLYFGKIVVTIHDIIPYFFPGHKVKFNPIRKAGFKISFFSSIIKAKKIIAVSENTKNDIVKYFNADRGKIKVIYEGVDRQFRKYNNEKKLKNFKARYKITKPFVFYTGVWRDHKNIVGLIKAFCLLKTKHNIDLQLVLGGKMSYNYNEAEKVIDKSNVKEGIIKVGFIEQKDLPLFYNAAQIFVLPSFYEGFGLTGLEAMACGTPVAASNRTSLPEVFGNSAVYFDPQNINEIAGKIKTLMEDKNLYNSLVKRGLERIKKYSWNRMGRETIKIYEEVMQKSN